MKQFKTKKAFTLAEIIITILVIGIVAVMTIPTLLKNNKTKQIEAAQKVLMTNLRTAMGNMQADEKLMGYKTTADFVNELQKYLKITQICDSSHLSDCFPGEFTAGGETKTIDDVKTSKDLGKKYTDDNVGIITVNGISAIVTYDPECQIQSTNLRDTNTLSCLGMMYDLNGKVKPNNTKTDIKLYNASLDGDCDGVRINGLCWLANNMVANWGVNCTNGRIPTEDELKSIFPAHVDQIAEFYNTPAVGSSSGRTLAPPIGFRSTRDDHYPIGVRVDGYSFNCAFTSQITCYTMCVSD